MEPLLDTVDRVTELGIRALLILIILGGYFELWYFGPWVRRQLADTAQRCADYRALAEKWEGIALKLLTAANRIVEQDERQR